MGEVADIGYAAILILGRVGACLAMLPGFGSTRFPVRFRLLLALALSLALSPLLLPAAQGVLMGVAGDAGKARLLAGEMVVGTGLGLMARLYILGMQFAASLITAAIGLAATPGAPIDDTELVPPLASLVTLTATAAIFAANLHYMMISALIDSYAAIGIGSPIDPGWYLDQMVAKISHTWSMGLRLASPFVVFAIIVNLAIGFANKFTPQISVYFMTMGLTAAAGLILLFFVFDDMIGLFLQEFNGFLD